MKITQGWWFNDDDDDYDDDDDDSMMMVQIIDLLWNNLLGRDENNRGWDDDDLLSKTKDFLASLTEGDVPVLIHLCICISDIGVCALTFLKNPEAC